MIKDSGMPDKPASRIRQPLEAVLFDMDGVITDVAKAYAVVWKQVYDEYLKAGVDREGEEFQPFDHTVSTWMENRAMMA